MEASCSSRAQVVAELEWALSTKAELALFDCFEPEDRPVVDRPMAGCIERTRSETAITDVGRHTPRRRRLVKPTPMSDYVCSEVSVSVPPQEPDEEERELESEAEDCCESEPLPQVPLLLHSMTLLRRVESVLQQAQKAALSAEALHQCLVAVCNKEKAFPAVLAHGASSDDALHEVGKDDGACNWTLINADGFGMHGAGRGGIREMTSCLDDDKVLFGVLRLSFNVNSQHSRKASPGFSTFGTTDACSRSKSVCHVFIHWVGPAVSAVRRGLLNAKCVKAVAMAKKHCTLTVQRRASSVEEVRLEDIVDDLRYLKALGAADCSGFEGGVSAEDCFRFLHDEEKVVSHLHSGKIAAPMAVHV